MCLMTNKSFALCFAASTCVACANTYSVCGAVAVIVILAFLCITLNFTVVASTVTRSTVNASLLFTVSIAVTDCFG